jgi:hypothetical protein
MGSAGGKPLTAHASADDRRVHVMRDVIHSNVDIWDIWGMYSCLLIHHSDPDAGFEGTMGFACGLKLLCGVSGNLRY